MLNPISKLDLPDPNTVSPDTTLDIALDTMQEKNLGCLVVTGDDDRLAGIFAQGDIFSQVAGKDIDLRNTTVGSLMTPDPTSLRRSAPIGHVLHLMAHHGYRHIPIIDGKGRPVKLASFKAILKSVGRLLED